MITKEKLQIFKNYNGDIDGWSRVESKKNHMDDEDWFAIEDLLQDLFVLARGNSSEVFNIKVGEKLKNSCSDNETIEELKKLLNGLGP